MINISESCCSIWQHWYHTIQRQSHRISTTYRSTLKVMQLFDCYLSIWLFCYQFMPHTHTRLTALFLGLPRWAGTRKVKPIWILLKQETVSGSGISWAICKSAPRSRQTTTPAPHHSVFYRPDAFLSAAAQPVASKHWRLLSVYATRVKYKYSMSDPPGLLKT